MPKLVDHDARRLEIIEATWRLVARNGIRATTMREIAREVGVGNGSLTPYFGNKEEILTATFRHVFTLADTRMHAMVGDRTGLAAVRAAFLAHSVRTEEQIRIAKVVVPFYDMAANDPALARAHEQMIAPWRTLYGQHLREAIDSGEARPDLDVDGVVDELIVLLTGVQVLVQLRSFPDLAERHDRVLDQILARLRPTV
jgi:AcrR family transcriptional regulator